MGLASSSAVGQAAEALGKFSTLIRVNLSSFDSKKKSYQDLENLKWLEPVETGSYFAVCFFFFFAGFQNLHVSIWKHGEVRIIFEF